MPYQEIKSTPTERYAIIAKGDVVAGDHIRFSEAVFGDSFRNSKFMGERVIEAEVVRDSYGSAKQQHTFTIRVLASEGHDPLPAGMVTTRKGRNIYRCGVYRAPWDDESARIAVADEKHVRGDAARAARREAEGYW